MLQGKVAIVTGASRGIGKAEAIGFARAGAAVVVSARTARTGDSRLPGSLDETVTEIEALGGQALAVPCDVSDEQDVERLVARAKDRFGRIDVLVNNAAAVYPKPLLETPLKRFRIVTEVNLTATFLMMKAVVPVMAEGGGGSIINTSSGTSQTRGISPLGAPYLAAKAAVEQLTMHAAAEFAPLNIAVNCFKPYKGVLTEGARASMPPDADLSGWAGPEAMVKAALFLARQDAGGVTATVAYDHEIIAWHGL